MSVFSITKEGSSSISAHRLFKALIIHRHVTMEKVKPSVFKSSELISGDGGVGSQRRIHFVDGHPIKSFVIRIDELDEEKHFCKYSIIEGGMLRDDLESIAYEVKYEGEGEGCKVKVTVNYHLKPGCSVNEQEVKMGEEKAMEMVKEVEAYLIANPDYCA